MGVTVEKITERLDCKVEHYPTGLFRTYRMDGKPVLRQDRGYEWFNHDKGERYIDCRVSGSYDRSITREEFEGLLEEFKQQPPVNKFFIETYTMPVGCTAWIQANRFPDVTDEEKLYGIWQSMVKEVKRDYPKARTIRMLKRRSAEAAFRDRESSICNREWELSPTEGKYRVTMYVKAA